MRNNTEVATGSPFSTSISFRSPSLAVFYTLAQWAGMAVALLGAVVLAGWVFDIELLKTVLPGLVPMKANSALAFVLAGFSLRLAARIPPSQWQRRCGQGGALLVALIGVFTFAEYLFGWNLGIDQFLVRDSFPAVSGLVPGRMALITALDFTALGMALLLLGRRTGSWVAQVLALAVSLVAFIALAGHLYSVEVFYRIGPYTSMALPTALGFVLLGMGVLATGSERGFAALLASDTLGGKQVRHLLPVVLVVPLAVGWLCLEGEGEGLYNTEFGEALVAVANGITLAAVVWWSGWRLHQGEILRQGAERALRESEERFRAFVTASSDVVYRMSPDWSEMRQLEGRNFIVDTKTSDSNWIQEYIHPDDQPQVMAAINEAIRTKSNFELEHRVRRVDGTLGWTFSRAVPLADAKGEIVEWFGAASDVTERKRTEEEIRTLNATLEQRVQERTAELAVANKELEAFSYSVSHDLRAPLRAIDGFSRILVEEYEPQLDPGALRYLQLVRNNTLQMGQLVDDLLALSRLGRKPLEKQEVAPELLVHQALEELRAEQEGRQIEIGIGELPRYQADPALLRQVFVNLLANAIKYTSRREVAHIEVGWQEGTYFVRDNGVGFDMRYAHKLFGVFQRLHRVEDYEGTGVGLAIVQRIVQRHGGRVWAEAELDKGATFYFTLGGVPS